MYEDDIKVILNPGQQTQAYDLASDPAEAYPLEVIETTQVVRVMAELETAVENDARLAGDQPEPGMDGIRKEQLKELGYIW